MASAPLSQTPVGALEKETFADSISALNVELLFDQLDAAIADQLLDSNARWTTDIHLHVNRAAECLGSLKKGATSHPAIHRGLAAASKLWQYPRWHYDALAVPDREAISSRTKDGWPRLLAAMLTTPAWQCENLPALDDVPDWLWESFTAWNFSAPLGFTAAGDAEKYARHFLRQIERLSHWAKRNFGSAAVRAATETYLRLASFAPLYLSTSDLSQHAFHHAQILHRVFHAPTEILAAAPLAGRMLRVGFILNEADLDGTTASGPALFRNLDPRRFDVSLYVTSARNPFCEALPQATVLPDSIADQVAILVGANLDVLIFGSDIAGTTAPIAQLACSRFAPVQIATSASIISTGLPTIDLFVTGTYSLSRHIATAENFTERVAVLNSAPRTYVPRASAAADSIDVLRAELGIAPEQVVFSSIQQEGQLTDSALKLWERVLSRLPEARVLVQLLGDPVSVSRDAERIRHHAEKNWAAGNGARLRVLETSIHTELDLMPLMRATDIFLEPLTGGNADLLLVPLHAHRPVLAWEGTTFRSSLAPALLRALGMDEMIFTDLPAFDHAIVQLAASPERRKAVRDHIQLTLQRTPLFLDPLAASEAMGAIALNAYSRMANVGVKDFRRDPTPLIPPYQEKHYNGLIDEARLLLDRREIEAAGGKLLSALAEQPAAPVARHLYGRVLVEQSHAERALLYLLAAVSQRESDQPLWKDLAQTLWSLGRTAEALQAIETCVRTNQQELEPWLILGEWARHLGHQEMAKEVAQLVRQIAPHDPRAEQFAAHVA